MERRHHYKGDNTSTAERIAEERGSAGGSEAGLRQCPTAQLPGSTLTEGGGYIARTPAKPSGEGTNRQGHTGAPTESEIRNHSCGTDGREEVKELAHPSAHPEVVGMPS